MFEEIEVSIDKNPPFLISLNHSFAIHDDRTGTVFVSHGMSGHQLEWMPHEWSSQSDVFTLPSRKEKLMLPFLMNLSCANLLVVQS